MKKILYSIVLLSVSIGAWAQALPNGGMETWRSSTAGSVSPTAIQAPVYWYGADSLIISDGQLFGTFLGIPASSWKRQIFQESTIKHSGSYAAKIMTRNQDTLGIFPGILSNSKANVPVSLTGVGTVTFSGGTAVSLRIDTVSAWVEYFPGKDSLGVTGPDTALLSAQAYAHIGTKDSLVGIGIAKIAPCSSFVQVFAVLAYTDTVDAIDTIRINITSSNGGASPALDSSTLYVDDVMMYGVPQTSHVAVPLIASQSSSIKVYPNPANEMIHFECGTGKNFTVTLYSINGSVAGRLSAEGTGQMDVSGLPTGLYFYQATQADGEEKRGLISVSH